MKILVTGADGFVGGWLVRRLLHEGHAVTGGIRMGGLPPALLTPDERLTVQWVEFDLLSQESVSAVVQDRFDGVVHLAAVASGHDARNDPGYAWSVNAAGTARLFEALGRRVAQGEIDPVALMVSTGEVYGHGRGRPHLETDPLVPASPYAASKVGAEVAALEVHRRTGLKVVVARPFPHTGPGQSEKYVVPALARRLRAAKRAAAPAIKAGNLEPVRDFLDVRDVAAAYAALLARGEPGVAYNVASGVGRALQAVVESLAELLGIQVIVERDQSLARPNDLRELVGNATRLRTRTGWAPHISFDQTLKDLFDAQAD
jgi:GDP-4-dehydro-6-deoxy-D-mannose reductase